MEELKMERISVEEIIRELNLPEDTHFVGHVVHLPESDEFLAKVKKTKSGAQRVWVKGSPGQAKIYGFEKALKQVVDYGRGAVVAYLLDQGQQYIVGACMDPVFNENETNSVTINMRPGG